MCDSNGVRIPTLDRPFHIHDYVKDYIKNGREYVKNKIIEDIRQERGGWLLKKDDKGIYETPDYRVINEWYLKDILDQSFDFNYFILLSITLSFLFSYFTVKFFLKYISKFSLNIFIIYRILIALFLLILIYG